MLQTQSASLAHISAAHFNLAQALCAARSNGARLPAGALPLVDNNEAYAVQDATLSVLGPIGGWKVGARGPGVPPTCAPLPASGLLPNGAALKGPAWHLRGIEAEVGFVLGSSLPSRPQPYTQSDLAAAIDAVLPIVEVVETRLADWLGAGAKAQLADLLSHGALILGQRQPFTPSWFDLSLVEAELRFDDQVVAHTVGEHPSGDVGNLVTWLANHCSARGIGLQAGQVITTGSCTGMLFASEGAVVQMNIQGLAPLQLHF